MQDFEAVIERVVKEVLSRLSREGMETSDTECTVCVSCGKCVEKAPTAVNNIKNAGAARISSSPGLAAVKGGLGELIDHPA